MNIDHFGIGKAVEMMKDGKKVARKGWDGKNLFLYYIPTNALPHLQTLPKV